MNGSVPIYNAFDRSIKECVQAAVLLEHVLQQHLNKDIPMEVQRSGLHTISIVFSRCLNFKHEQLVRGLTSLARTMLANFAGICTEIDFEEPRTNYPTIADLLDLEGI